MRRTLILGLAIGLTLMAAFGAWLVESHDPGDSGRGFPSRRRVRRSTADRRPSWGWRRTSR